MRLLLGIFGIIILFTSTSCDSPTALPQRSANSGSPSPSSPEMKEAPPKRPDNVAGEPANMTSVFVDSDTLTQGDYTLEKLTKKVRLEQTEGTTEVSYAVLKRKGKVLKTFDGVYAGEGNLTDFGQFSFLGTSEKQLIISQTIPRGGRHWIVSLSPAFRVIFDSEDYHVGREDLSVLDIDKDGKYELLLEDTSKYRLKLPPSETPLPLVIFRYDEKKGRYVPADQVREADGSIKPRS